MSGGTSPKCEKLRTGIHEKLDEAIFKWFLSARSQNVLIGAVVFKAKTLEYAKEIGLDDFQPSDGWIRHWKKRYNISFKTITGEANNVTTGMVAPWKETSLPTYYQTTILYIFTMQMNLVCSMFVYQVRVFTLSLRNVLGETQQSTVDWDGSCQRSW